MGLKPVQDLTDDDDSLSNVVAAVGYFFGYRRDTVELVGSSFRHCPIVVRTQLGPGQTKGVWALSAEHPVVLL